MNLEVKNLMFSYEDKDVIKNISFDAADGDCLAILGPNGVGKTTLIRILSGLYQPLSGTIKLKNDKIGTDIESSVTDLSQTVIQQNSASVIGVMMPITGIYLKMTAFEYLSFIGALCNMGSEVVTSRIEELSRKLHFDNELYRPIGKYSTGTRKKVEFCAAILPQPVVLLLDEPFESVDPEVCFEIKSFISNYVRQHKIVIISSHIISTIQNLCTNYLIIDDGTVVDSGVIDSEIDLEQRYMKVASHGSRQ